MSIKGMARCVAGVCLLFVTASAWADAQVLIDSDPGDFVGGGEHTTYSSGITATGSGNSVQVSVLGRYSMSFVVPDNVGTFVVGNYGEAERSAFRSPLRPGIEIGNSGRGCNMISGWFRVLQVVFDGSGNPQQLAIDFKQYCDSGSAALYGAVRINSTLPLDVSGPFAIAGPPAEVIEGLSTTLDGGQSFQRDGSGLSYQWLQQSGPSVQLVGSTSAAPSFTAPGGVPLGGTDLVFKLQVSSSKGSDTDTVKIKLHSKSDRQTYVDFNSQSGDFVGAGANYHFDLSNTRFSYTGNQSGVHLFLVSDATWDVDMTPPPGAAFSVGAYEGAQRWPFQGSSPGLSIGGDGRGCNTLTGRFDVTEAQADATGALTAFGADFEQHCEGGTPALLGTVRYNYLDSHVPTALAGPAQSVMAGQTVTLDGSGSSDPMGTLTAYQWTQTQGPTVALSDTHSTKPTFVAPSVTGAQDLVFSLLVTDNLGYMATAVTQVTDTPASSSSSGGGSSSSSSSSSGGGGDGGGAFGWQTLALLGLFAALRFCRRRGRVMAAVGRQL